MLDKTTNTKTSKPSRCLNTKWKMEFQAKRKPSFAEGRNETESFSNCDRYYTIHMSCIIIWTEEAMISKPNYKTKCCALVWISGDPREIEIQVVFFWLLKCLRNVNNEYYDCKIESALHTWDTQPMKSMQSMPKMKRRFFSFIYIRLNFVICVAQFAFVLSRGGKKRRNPRPCFFFTEKEQSFWRTPQNKINRPKKMSSCKTVAVILGFMFTNANTKM